MYSLPSSFDEQSVAVHGAAAGLDDASLAILRDLTRRIATDVQLREPASTLHHVLFETDDDFAPAVKHADRAFGADAGVLHALLVLDSMRLVGERQSARGIPANIAQAIRDRFGGAWLREGMDRVNWADLLESRVGANLRKWRSGAARSAGVPAARLEAAVQSVHPRKQRRSRGAGAPGTALHRRRSAGGRYNLERDV